MQFIQNKNNALFSQVYYKYLKKNQELYLIIMGLS